MADDGTVSIRIAGAVDSSLTASTSAAKDSLADLTASGNAAADTLSGGLKEGFASSALAALHTAGAIADLGQKLSSNDIVGAASEVAEIAVSFSELGAAALGPVGAIAAVGGALAYLGERAVKAADDTAKIELSGLGTKGFVASKEQIDEFEDRLDELPDVSSEDARKVVLGFQTMENRSQASMEGLSAATKGWADVTGQTLQEAGDRLRDVFGNPFTASAQQFIANLRNCSQAQLDDYREAKRLGDVYGAQKAMLEALGATIDAGRSKLEAHSAAIDTNWRNLLVYAGGLISIVPSEQGQVELNKASKLTWDDLAAGIRNAIAAFGKMPTTPTQLSAPNLDAYVEHLQVAANLAGETASQRHIDGTLIEAATAKLRDQGDAEKTIVTNAAQARAILGSQADAIAKLAAQGEKPDSGNDPAKDAAKAREAADKIISINKQTNDAILAGKEQLNASMLALGQESLSHFVAEEQRLAAQKLAADSAAAAQEAAAGKITHAELTGQLALLDAEYANKKAQIDDQAAEKAQEANDKRLADFQKTLEEQVKLTEEANQRQFASGQITAQQKLSNDISALDTAKQLDDQAFAAATAKMDTASDAYQAQLARRNEFDKWYYDQLNTLATQQAAADIAQWKTTDQAIESAESQLVGDIFSKRQGLSKDLRQVALKELEQEIQDDIKALTEHELVNLGMLNSDQATAQAGALAHMAEWGAQQLGIGGAAAGTAGWIAKGTGQAGQQAALTANTQALAALYQAITGHTLATGTNTSALGLGTSTTATNTTVAAAHTPVLAANTGAALTNTSASVLNTGATTADAAATGSNLLSTLANTISIDANTLATWADAAAAAISAFFASGSDNIPFDMPAIVHKGEMIIPAHVASQVRAGNMNIGNLADIAASNDLMPVDIGHSPLLGSRSNISGGSGGDSGVARGGDAYNMGGLHIHGMDLASIAHNPAFQREIVKVARNMHRNAVRR
ncbi:MAG: hypothetical protein ABSC92_12440 [Rhizomicrobium sp.]|jgi:hypothetical protein